MDIPDFSPEVLQKVLAEPGIKETSIGLYETCGWLLAMVSAPVMIQPSEWLPVIFTDNEIPELESVEQVESLVGNLMVLWNHWLTQVETGIQLPDACAPGKDDVPNAALRAFCAGYLQACDWLDDDWDEAIELLDGAIDEEKGTLEQVLSMATMFCSVLAHEDEFPEDKTPPANRETAFRHLPEILTIVAKAGREISLNIGQKTPASTTTFVRSTPKAGRNCLRPCGSGKKTQEVLPPLMLASFEAG